MVAGPVSKKPLEQEGPTMAKTKGQLGGVLYLSNVPYPQLPQPGVVIGTQGYPLVLWVTSVDLYLALSKPPKFPMESFGNLPFCDQNRVTYVLPHLHAFIPLSDAVRAARHLKMHSRACAKAHRGGCFAHKMEDFQSSP